LQHDRSQLIGSLEVSIDTKLQTSTMKIDSVYFGHHISLTIMILNWQERLIRVHIDRTVAALLTLKAFISLSGTPSVALLWAPCNRPTAAEALYVPFFQENKRIQPQVWPEIVPLKRGYQWDKVL
ncbi:unnamed protein product, partial [Brassica oleracea]